MSFSPRTFPEILGEMIARMIALTPLTDVNFGSVLTTLLEAAAQEDDEQYFQMLEIIRNFALDTTTGTDLDDRAIEYNLTRLPARNASTRVTLSDSAIAKKFTQIYSALPGPDAGTTSLNGVSSVGFPTTGSIIVGRGTTSVETVPYSSITANIGYVTFNLSAPLSFDHGVEEAVILSQGGARTIPIGTLVAVPASDINEQIDYTVDANAIILDGESFVAEIPITAVVAGSAANVPIGSINLFPSPPFSTAVVSNPQRVTNGRDEETDQELRDRIKDTIQSLSRGTPKAINSGVIGLLSEIDNKRVVSASLVEPTLPAEVVKLYIDDGTGFLPSTEHVGFEEVVALATGGEKFLRADNVPILKATLETQNVAPFLLIGGEILTVEVNGVFESITFDSTDFSTPGAASSQEVLTKINRASTLIEARKTIGDGVRIFARASSNERIRVVGGDANTALNFSLVVKSSTNLYLVRNYEITQLGKDGITASTESTLSELYNMSSPQMLCLVVDGNVAGPQLVFFDPADFAVPAFATAEEVAALIDSEISGITSVASSDATRVRITSNQIRSARSKVRVIENFDAAWKVVLGTPTDISAAVKTNSSNTPFFTNDQDMLYVGHNDVRFQSIYFNFAATANASLLPIFEFWDGLVWAPLGVYDGTNGMQQAGFVTFRAPHTWAKVIFQTGAAKYWIRIRRNNPAVISIPTESRIKVCSMNEVLGFTEVEAVGMDRDYTLNRFIGQFELETPLLPGDQITLGSYDTRAYAVSINGPFGIFGGEILNFTLDGVPKTITFQAGDFVIPGVATPAEIATALNARVPGVSATVIDLKVKLRTATWADTGTVQVTGGTANVVLGFSTAPKTAFFPHVPAIQSIAGPFAFSPGMTIVAIIDGNLVNSFSVPCGKTGALTNSLGTTIVFDTALTVVFPDAADLPGYQIRLTSGAFSGQTRTISSYIPGTGQITVSVAFGGVPAAADTYEIMPVNADQVVRLWNNRRVTQLSTKAVVSVSGGGTKVQIESPTIGEDGSVNVPGGTGNAVLQFPTAISKGVDGYRYFTNLLQLVQQTVDGKIDDPENFPGLRAAGVQIEVAEPVSVLVTIEIDITMSEGFTVVGAENDIKSAISAYINNLKVGQDVVISEVICAVQDLLEVSDVQMISPTANIAIADNELARISENDIVVG